MLCARRVRGRCAGAVRGGGVWGLCAGVVRGGDARRRRALVWPVAKKCRQLREVVIIWQEVSCQQRCIQFSCQQSSISRGLSTPL